MRTLMDHALELDYTGIAYSVKRFIQRSFKEGTMIPVAGRRQRESFFGFRELEVLGIKTIFCDTILPELCNRQLSRTEASNED